MRKLLTFLFCLLLTACNLPDSETNDELNSQAVTIIAMTLETGVTSTPEYTPLASPTAAGTESPTPTITPTYSTPMLNVNETTNCRTGPGQNYEIITTFAQGVSVEITGRYPVNNFWVVIIPGSTETCWIWGDFSTASGSYWVVPSVTPPAPATARPAGQPTNLTYTYTCSFNGVNSDVSVSMQWNDNADNELGYRVFRDNGMIAELPANTTTYGETVAADATQTLTYGVAAIDASGESERATISFSCQ